MFLMNFLRLCNQVDKSPNAVATEIGIKSSGSVTAWKNGTVPYARTLQKIADYFGVTKEELLSDNEEGSRSKTQDSNKKEKAPGISAKDLTEEEQEAIEYFRKLSPEERAFQLYLWKARANHS